MIAAGTRVKYQGAVQAWDSYTGVVVPQEPWMAEYIDAGGNPIKFDVIDADNIRFFKDEDLLVLKPEYEVVANDEPSLEDYPESFEQAHESFPPGFVWDEEEGRPVFKGGPDPETLWATDEEAREQFLKETFPPGFKKEGHFRHPDSIRFHDWLDRAGELHDLKQRDYGTGDDPFANVRRCERYGIPAWVGCAIRMADKMARIEKAVGQWAAGEDISMANESLLDSFNDLGVYSGIGYLLLEDFHGRNES